MALASKIVAFKNYFNIKSEIVDVELMLDKKNNFIVKFHDKEYILNNQRNKEKFLSYETMKFKTKTGVKFLCAIRLEASKEEKAVGKTRVI